MQLDSEQYVDVKAQACSWWEKVKYKPLDLFVWLFYRNLCIMKNIVIENGVIIIEPNQKHYHKDCTFLMDKNKEYCTSVYCFKSPMEYTNLNGGGGSTKIIIK